jgi:hypothetical protein
MHPTLELLLAPLLWFAVAAAALFVLATVYVHALLVVAELSRLLRVALSAILWLTFAAAAVAPLFGWISIARARYPAALEFPALLWVLLCFGLCFVAVHRPIKRRLPQLQAAGLFRQ